MIEECQTHLHSIRYGLFFESRVLEMCVVGAGSAMASGFEFLLYIYSSSVVNQDMVTATQLHTSPAVDLALSSTSCHSYNKFGNSIR